MIRSQYEKYKDFIHSEFKVRPRDVEPHKFYRLHIYRKSAKNTEYYEGEDSVFLFSTGIYLEKMYCLKLTSIHPDDFFTWFRAITRDTSVLNENTEFVDVHTLAPVIDKGGMRIYDVYIKNYNRLNRLENSYRSYNIDSIIEIHELRLKTDELKKVIL